MLQSHSGSAPKPGGGPHISCLERRADMLTLMHMTPAPGPPRAGVPTFGVRPTVRTTGDPQSIALTFDDGPNPAVTPQLLRLLARYGVKATFFLVGRHVRANAGLAREIVSAGHSVGN